MLVVSPYISNGFDSDTITYINGVEGADNQTLEWNTRMAFDRFIKGCKRDGIWNAISSSCILAGARTLDGALTPLKGPSPTNYNFVSGDYDRKTGLTGDGATKYLDSGVDCHDFPEDDVHLSLWKQRGSIPNVFLGGAELQQSGSFFRNRSNATPSYNSSQNNFIGTSRSKAAGFNWVANGTVSYFEAPSNPSQSSNILVFCRDNSSNPNVPSPNAFAPVTLGFYSAGTDIDLALLYARVSQLMTDINNAF